MTTSGPSGEAWVGVEVGQGVSATVVDFRVTLIVVGTVVGMAVTIGAAAAVVGAVVMTASVASTEVVSPSVIFTSFE